MTHPTPRPPWQPLAGLRVVDFTALLPGPFLTAMLADLGAEVVKVEPPGGDSGRRYQPDMFRAVNRGKRSLTLDLKTPAARGVAHRMAAGADVVVESSRPGVAERLGIGWADLRAVNPRLIYGSLSSYGQDGPWRDHPAHDINIVAASGGLGLPGHWTRPPSRLSLPFADFAAGSMAATAILAALRERDRTGQGTVLDLGLFEAALYCAAMRHGGEEPADPRGHLSPVNDSFETADGRWIALGLLEDHFWARFRDAVREEAPDLADPALDTNEGRRAAGDRLAARVADLMRTRTLADWLPRLRAADLPAEPCLTPAEAMASEQATARGLVTRTADGAAHVVFPVRAGGRLARVQGPPPGLGADADAVLGALGYGPDDIDALRASGAFGATGGQSE
ncbi:MAG TPA: CoA transferase [Azospirillum sp.]|nr:CoA transferase [Azospirillum sp.]